MIDIENDIVKKC